LPIDSNPEKFAFTQWLAKQQMAQVMTNLQQQNPELSFDFSSSAASTQTPMEFMQSLMKSDAIEKMRREQQNAKNSEIEEGEGPPAFQCSQEPAIKCSAKDIPNAPGEAREEVVLLMEAYNAILNNEKDCKKIEQSIDSIGEQLQWRKSERRIKANLEDLALECFYRENNLEKTIEHARKLQCTGDESYINSVYWYMTAMNHRAGDKPKALKAYQCFQEATTYLGQHDFSPAYVASRHRESGALAWLYFDDLSTATTELIKGRTLLKGIPDKTPAMLQVIAEIDLDLMETYVTANIDKDTFDELLEEINSSGLLTDGYKQIKDTLAAIYHMQNNDTDEALIPLGNLSSRFNLMPEFICGWDWSGFVRGLEESISDDNIREQAKNLVSAANCYIPQTMQGRIQNINKVSQWLQSR
jgi:tetratricopeptide (TPR) repeat protein